MERFDILDCSRDSPQWSEILAARRGSIGQLGAGGNSLWPVYGPLVGPSIRDKSFVIGQIGQSLDGRIATKSGHSHYINGMSARTHLHRLRALADAVIVGVGTVIADDPLLTVRHVEGPHPARVIIDPNGRLPPTARCLNSDNTRRIVIQVEDRSRPAGVESLILPATAGKIEAPAILSALRNLGLHRILIEGGAATLSRFLYAGCIDRLHVMLAPLIIGSGVAGIELPAIARLDEALRPAVSAFGFADGDFLFDCDFRKPGS